MREHIYTVAKGNEVRPEFVGKTVSMQRVTTIAEAVGEGKPYENEEALVNAAEEQRLIKMRDKCRTILGTPEGTLESAGVEASKVRVGAPREAQPQKPKTPQAKVRATAVDAGTKILERAASDPKVAATLIKNQLITQEDLDAYIAAKSEVAVASQKVADGQAEQKQA